MNIAIISATRKLSPVAAIIAVFLVLIFITGCGDTKTPEAPRDEAAYRDSLQSSLSELLVMADQHRFNSGSFKNFTLPPKYEASPLAKFEILTATDSLIEIRAKGFRIGRDATNKISYLGAYMLNLEITEEN